MSKEAGHKEPKIRAQWVQGSEISGCSEARNQAIDRARVGHREDEIQDVERIRVKP